MGSQSSWFSRLPRELQLHFSLELAKAKAQLGRDSFFNRWWFFDTNCLSELVKLHRAGHSSSIHQLLEGKDVLVASTALQEMRKAPDLLELLEDALDDANAFLLADETRFWWTDICNFLNVDRLPINSLDVRPCAPGFLAQVTDREEFHEVCAEAEEQVRLNFFSAIEGDIGASLDERDLCVYIWSRVNECAQEWFDIRIPPADVNARDFPAFYVFFYAYYFRFVKNKVTAQLNDFIDLANCLAAPYCDRFYGEAKFTQILRGYVQGREPPSTLQVIKRVYKKGLIDSQTYQAARQKRATLGQRYTLLPTTTVFTLSEMQQHVLGHAAPTAQ